MVKKNFQPLLSPVHFLWMNVQTNGQQKMYPGVGQVLGSAVDMKMGAYAPYAGVSSGAVPSWQASMQFPYQPTVPSLVGKG